jgi:hypothetical protein
MLAAATAGSFMASNASVASIAIIVIVFWIAAIGSLVTCGWAGAAKLAWHRLANANLQRRDGHAPRRHRIVAGDAVKVMRLLLPAIVDRYR